MKTEPTSLRLDAEAKKQAYIIFDQVGLKPAQAMNLFLRQVVLKKGIPFTISIPNKSTTESIEELEGGGGQSFKNSEDFYDDLGI